MKAKRLFGIALSALVTVALIPTAAFAEGEGDFSFKMGISIAEGTDVPENYGVDYQVIDETDNDAQGDFYNGYITSSELVDIDLEGLGEGYRIKFWVSSGSLGIRLNGNEVDKNEWSNEVLLDFSEISNDYGSVMNFELFSDNNGSDEPGPEPEAPHGGYEGERVHSDLTITGEADFYINDSNMINSVSGENQAVDYTYGGNGNVDFYITSFINARYTSFKINGTEYYDQLPTPDTPEGRRALLEANKGQINEFKLTVPYSENGYVIEAAQKFLDDSDADYMMVGNFLWTYTDKNQGDDYIDHGRLELIKMEYDGETYLPEDLNNPGTAFDWGQNENGGSAVLPVGSVVTVKLVPEYGYQLTGFGINGGSFGTGDEQSTFTFEIRSGNAHLGAHFTPVDDKVAATAEAVTGGSIEIGADEINTGTVVLSVDDADALSDEQVESFETAAEGYEVSAYLDINLDQVIYKGTDNADDAWKNELSELQNEATITLTLDEGVDGSEFVIIHEKHDGSYEVLPVEFDDEANTITFATSSFSNYAVAAKSDVTTPDDQSEPDDPKTPDDSDVPETPDDSNVPETPDDSDVPETPDDSDTSDTTDKSDVPDTGSNDNLFVGGILMATATVLTAALNSKKKKRY
ncbi:MAG: hypothetical protein ACI4JA_00205 [Oscillospiraceae bacterium]